MSNKIWVWVGVALVVVLGVSLPRNAPGPAAEVDLPSIVEAVTTELADTLGGPINTVKYFFYQGLEVQNGFTTDTLTTTGAISSSGQITNNGGILHSSVNATSTPASLTLRESDLLNYSTIIVSPTGAASAKTLTLPATSTLTSLIPDTGDMVEITFVNASTTVAAGVTLAAGTGITVQNATSTLTIAGQGIAILRLVRMATTDVIAFFSYAI